MLGELLEVTTKLSEVSDRLKQARKERRERIANYFLNVEKCLQDSAEQLKNGTVPSSKWGELETYGWELPETIGKEIGEEKAKELACLLMRTASQTPTSEEIHSIQTVAGKFKGLANTVITKPDGDDSTRRKVLIYTAIGTAGLGGGLFLNKVLNKVLSPFLSSQPSPRNPSSNAERFPFISWEMNAFLSDNVGKTILFDAPQQVCDRVRRMTQDRFNITLKRTGETEEILRKISDGNIECGYSGIYYSTPKYRALFFGCAIPFGLSPQEQTTWLNYKKNPNDELTFIQSIYREKLHLNVIPFPAGATGGQMGGWFRTKINSLDDLKGKVMRIPGLGAEVFQRLGMTTHEQLGQSISVDEAIQRLKDGRFSAVEWTSPYDDLQLGLNEAAKFYYYPGWWEPSTTLDVQVNIDAWNKLPLNYQEIFKLACHETYTSILAEYEQKNSIALKEIQQKGVELLRFSNDVLKAAKHQTKLLLNLYAKQDAVFKEVYYEWRSFKERIRAWSNLTKIE
jgi:TRAP-type mannitol/chloroaromatic compound transport system substrate-binding protein